MRVLGIVPARGGSKGIPRKNIRLLAGKPLLQYTAEAALGAMCLEKTLLSTDDSEIAELGARLGLWVPFLRPAALAQDDTPTLPVLEHVIEWLATRGEWYDAYCLLQPTSPLRSSQEIDQVLTRLAESAADSVITLMPVTMHLHPAWQLQMNPSGEVHLWNGQPLNEIITRRQLLAPTYVRSGSIYAMRHTTLVEQHSLYGKRCIGYIQSLTHHINLDTEQDWEFT